MIFRIAPYVAAALAMMALSTAAKAETDLERALASGAKQMTSSEIAERLTGKTVTFVSAENGAKFLVYYGANNEAASSKVGGDWSATGFHAVTDRDQICLGWKGSDLPKLRCLEVLLIDGVMHKFKADGSLSGKITDFADGNTT